MPASTLSVFGEPDDFRDALRGNGVTALVVADSGKFWARLSRISLYRMRLFAGEEHLSRAASVSISPKMVRVTLPAEPATSLTWNGVRTRPNEIATHGAGHRFEEWTDGPCRWRTIWLRMEDLANSGHAVTGQLFRVPPGECRWQPRPEALRSLIRLHSNAVRATATRAKLPVEKEAARGLEQELLLAVIECLVSKPPAARTRTDEAP